MIDIATVEFVVINMQLIVLQLCSLYCILTSKNSIENKKKQLIVTILQYVITITTVLSIIGTFVLTFFTRRKPNDEDRRS